MRINDMFPDDPYIKMVEKVAEQCFKDLSDKDIAHFRMNPSYGDYHFSYGMYIRNAYSKWFHEAEIKISGDSMSHDVFNELMRHILPEYKEYPLCYEYLDYNNIFQDIHCQVLNRNQVCPIDLIEKSYSILEDIEEYRETHSAFPPGYWDIRTNSEQKEYLDEHRDKINEIRRNYDEGLKRLRVKFVFAIAEKFWNWFSIKEKAKQFMIPDEVIKDGIAVCQHALESEEIVIPSSHVFLYNEKGLRTDVRNTVTGELALFIKRNNEHTSLLPGWLFERRCFVEAAVKEYGTILSEAPLFQNDFDIVSSAVADMPTAIKYATAELKSNREILKKAAAASKCSFFFNEEDFKKYNDDAELVQIALKANGANIAYAADHFKDDYDMAKLALENISNIYPDTAYKSLSKRLRHDKSLALIMISSGYPSLRRMPDKLRDDDKIAEAIYKNPNIRYFLCDMSDRIKKKYGVDE